MILVDTSVWIDRLAARTTLQTLAFERLLHSREALAVGDLVLMEVLQGARDERHANDLSEALAAYTPTAIVDRRVAVHAASNYRFLRAKGITVRKTVDTLIATRCILDDLPLLYADRDFDPFIEHLGLRSALDLPSGPT